jgi:hypothetical protein
MGGGSDADAPGKKLGEDTRFLPLPQGASTLIPIFAGMIYLEKRFKS